MKRKASISHDEAIIRRLRKDPGFASKTKTGGWGTSLVILDKRMEIVS